MRIIFMGTPDFSVPTLRALHEAGHEIVAAYSQPPRRAGRGKKERPSPVHLAAEELGIAVRTPHSLKHAEAQADFLALEADAAVVAAYGLLLPQIVLDGPKHGCLNVHASLLPRWRGAAPVQRAILAGDSVTGVTIMQMEAGLDTGPMLAREQVPIGAQDNAGILTDQLAFIGAELMVRVLADLPAFAPSPQPEDGVTYARKIDKAEAHIDFAQSAETVDRQVRAFNPAPGAWFELDGERIKLLGANVIDAQGSAGTVIDEALTIACGDGAIRPLIVQRAGKPAMDRADFLRGRPVAKGTVLA